MKKTEKELLKKLGEEIKQARKNKKISQSELAEKTWIDRSYISMVERWETNITFLKLKRIDEELGLSLKI
jgi:XRE family transcriptional regulator, regulator of sulfur utilization